MIVELPGSACVVLLGQDDLAEAAAVLAAAFIDYPLSRYIFAAYGDALGPPLRASFYMDCAWRPALGWPLLGVRLGAQLAATAVIVGPGPRPSDHPLAVQEQLLNLSFGPLAAQRLQAYADLKERHAPAQPHFYLESIGVLPACRGQGLGGLLLRRLQQDAAANPEAACVALDTQLPANLPLYRHLGFRVTAEDRLGDVPMWFMVWNCPHRTVA